MNYKNVNYYSYSDSVNCIYKLNLPFLISVYNRNSNYLLVNSSNFLDFKISMDFYPFSAFGFGSLNRVSYSNSQFFISMPKPDPVYKNSYLIPFIETGSEYFSLYASYVYKKLHKSDIFTIDISETFGFFKHQLKLSSGAKYTLFKTNDFFQKFSLAQFFRLFFSSYYTQRLIKKNKKFIHWPFFSIIGSMLSGFVGSWKTKRAKGSFMSAFTSIDPSAYHLHSSSWSNISRNLIKKLSFRIRKFRFIVRYCKYSLAIKQRRDFRKKNIERYKYQFRDWTPRASQWMKRKGKWKIRRFWLARKFRVTEKKRDFKKSYRYARLIYNRVIGIQSYAFDSKIHMGRSIDFLRNYLKKLIYFAEILVFTPKFRKKIRQFLGYFIYYDRIIIRKYNKSKKNSKLNILNNIRFRVFHAASKIVWQIFSTFLKIFFGRKKFNLRIEFLNRKISYIFFKLQKILFIPFSFTNSVSKFSPCYISWVLNKLKVNFRFKFSNSKMLFKSKFPFLHLVNFTFNTQYYNNFNIKFNSLAKPKRQMSFLPKTSVRSEPSTPSYKFRQNVLFLLGIGFCL